jgi:hypothetical protein
MDGSSKTGAEIPRPLVVRFVWARRPRGRKHPMPRAGNRRVHGTALNRYPGEFPLLNLNSRF